MKLFYEQMLDKRNREARAGYNTRCKATNFIIYVYILHV